MLFKRGEREGWGWGGGGGGCAHLRQRKEGETSSIYNKLRIFEGLVMQNIILQINP